MQEVLLVGAGPGDPGLLTVAGRAALERAQVLAYDAPINPAIVALAPGTARRIPVTRRDDPGATPYTEIAALMAGQAKDGLRVVRLKGGDPFLYGRGHEEIKELEALGVPVKVIPGLSSALAGPASAGIPVTCGDMSGSVHIFSGRPRTGRALDLNYMALAGIGGTLIFLMAADSWAEISAGLLSAGMSPKTPAAWVENGTLEAQRRISATLETLNGQGIGEPAVLVIGPVCGL